MPFQIRARLCGPVCVFEDGGYLWILGGFSHVVAQRRPIFCLTVVISCFTVIGVQALETAIEGFSKVFFPVGLRPVFEQRVRIVGDDGLMGNCSQG